MTLIDTYRGYVSLAECDEMGHMNIQHYVGKASDAHFNLRAALGLGYEHQAREHTTYVALEHHIRFHRELRASDLVLIRSGIVEVREKTMRVYQEAREILDDRLAATLVLDVGHFDLDKRKLTPWPAHVRKKAKALMAELPDHAAARSLPADTLTRDISLARADELGMLETNRSAVAPWECDSNGHMNTRFFMARVSDAQGHMWAHAGLGRHEQAARGLATATVETRLAYRRELMAGQTIVVRTSIEADSARTLRYRHWLFNGETGEPAFEAVGCGLLFDKSTRKAVTLPDDVKARLAEKNGN